MAHPVTQRRALPGGIKPRVTVIDAAHPLSTLDPGLDAILVDLTPKILENYRKAKHMNSAESHEIVFVPVEFTTQVVAGTNYYVKLLVEDECHDHNKSAKEYVHIRIFSQTWTKTVQLTGFSANKHAADSLQDAIDTVAEGIASCD
ncbi:hypothetical protein BGX27_011161 [Mortierella sp. AM989]|nr:hypothetical protein BGX27_011161 [Mortierella sp. AM989]